MHTRECDRVPRIVNSDKSRKVNVSMKAFELQAPSSGVSSAPGGQAA